MRDKNDIDTCVAAGVDALGFLVGITHVAEDKIDIHFARNLISDISSPVLTVAVTHYTEVKEIVDICSYLNVSVVQIHADVSPEVVQSVRNELSYLKIIKAFHVGENANVDFIKNYIDTIDAILLDTRTKDRLGGTGITHDWNISRKIVEVFEGYRVILAGGLNSSNLSNAMGAVKPWGVDVNTGVETISGAKDPNKVKEFVEIAKNVMYPSMK